MFDLCDYQLVMSRWSLSYVTFPLKENIRANLILL